MKRSVSVLLAVTVIGGASSAAATNKQQRGPNGKLFAALDLDRDGTVSRHELFATFRRHVQKQVARRFAQLDRNRDGRVTVREVAAMQGDRFARFDINGDGCFTESELRAVMVSQVEQRLEHLLADLDTDADRTCSYTELTAHRARIATARREREERRRVAAREAEKRPQRTEQAEAAKAKTPSSRASF